MIFSSTLQSRFDAGSNNFDAIRLVAALLVLFGHAYALVPLHSGFDRLRPSEP